MEKRPQDIRFPQQKTGETRARTIVANKMVASATAGVFTRRCLDVPRNKVDVKYLAENFRVRWWDILICNEDGGLSSFTPRHRERQICFRQ